MEAKESNEINKNGSHISVARFELNRTQASLILVVSLMGVIILPFSIVGNILFNLFQFIFDTLPIYLLESHHYHEDYLIYHLTPIITSLILNILLLILSIYGLKRTIKQKDPNKQLHRRIIPLNRRVNWFGLKLSHGQSIFIFCVSLIGILYIIPELIHLYIIPEFIFGLFFSLCIIPTGPSSGIGHLILDTYVPRAILIIFIIFCLFSLFITRRGKPITSSTRITKNYSLLIFIVSFVLLIFLSARIFCHLALFNPDISDMLGIAYSPTNPYQNSDFIKTFVLFLIFLAIMITSFFLKDRPYEKRNSKKELTWLHKKLTPQRAIILISLAVFSFIIIFFDFLFYLFYAIIIIDFRFTSFISIIYYTSSVVIFIFCYYPIGKLLKDNRLDRFIAEINSESNFETRWFTSRLDKLNSIIFLSVSCGLIVFYIYQLIMHNVAANMLMNELFTTSEYLLYSFPIITVIIGAILILNVYTIRKTLPSLKSHE